MRASAFTRTMLSIAVPVTLQNLLFSSFTLIDTLMIGTLGDAPLAAVGMAGKWTWFFTIVLFGFGSGNGYPADRVVPEQRNKKILDAVRAHTLKDLLTCLKGIDQELVRGAIAGEHFSELFFAHAKDEAIIAYVRELLG